MASVDPAMAKEAIAAAATSSAAARDLVLPDTVAALTGRIRR
jgi:hypothetical protein